MQANALLKITTELVPCYCGECGHSGMKEMFYSDINDSYLLQCPVCQTEKMMHFSSYDIIMGHYDNEESTATFVLNPFMQPDKTSGVNQFNNRINKIYDRLIRSK